LRPDNTCGDCSLAGGVIALKLYIYGDQDFTDDYNFFTSSFVGRRLISTSVRTAHFFVLWGSTKNEPLATVQAKTWNLVSLGN